MTSEQRRLAYDLVITPPSGLSKISREQFALRFPDALVEGRLSPDVLADAHDEKNPEDLQCALISGDVFGFSSKHEDLLCRLVSENWHVSHENVVSALAHGNYQDERAIEALYYATRSVPSYLEFDDNRALAVKAIWALGKIPGPQSEAKLKLLADSPSPRLRETAEMQLTRRQGKT